MAITTLWLKGREEGKIPRTQTLARWLRGEGHLTVVPSADLQPMVAWQGVGEEDKYTAVTFLSSLAPTRCLSLAEPSGNPEAGEHLDTVH